MGSCCLHSQLFRHFAVSLYINSANIESYTYFSVYLDSITTSCQRLQLGDAFGIDNVAQWQILEEWKGKKRPEKTSPPSPIDWMHHITSKNLHESALICLKV